MMRMRLLVICAMLLLQSSVATGQYIFIDANGDGMSSVLDKLAPNNATKIDIWLQTDRNRDLSPAVSALRYGVPVSVFSYEFILNAVGGTVEWGPYTNALLLLPELSATLSDPTCFYVGYRGSDPLPAGRYLLGSLTVRVKTGKPDIRFASSAPQWPGVLTSIGSLSPGKNRCHTLCFTSDPSKLGVQDVDIPSDWSDADGISGNVMVEKGVAGSPAQAELATFGARLTPNPMNPSATLTVTTTRPGVLRVRIYSPSGRLVRVLLDQASVPGGTHAIQISGRASDHPLPSGVYYYRVEATEGTLTGDVVLLK